MGVVISIILSILAIVVSIVSLIISTRQSKKDSFQSISSLLIEQKNAFLEGYANYGGKEDVYSKYLINELAANYCNAYENACALYLNNGISRKLFKTVFKDELKTIVNKEGVASQVDGFPDIADETDCYENLFKVHKLFLNCK